MDDSEDMLNEEAILKRPVDSVYMKYPELANL